MAPSARRRTLRWSAPFATAAVIALIVAVPGLSAASTPSLAAVTPAQLIAKIEQVKVNNLSGSLNLTPNLGIPNLSALTNAAGGGGHGAAAFSPTDLLSGTHQALVWFAGPDKSRVALLQSLAETDVVHNGHDVWLWDSTSKKVTHYTLAAGATAGTKAGTQGVPAATDPAEAVQTPQQMADHLLAQITPSTAVSVGSPVTVAKQKAYQLILAPHSAASTIDHAVIAVDSVTGLPLQVQIFAKGQKAAALKLGFGKIDYSTPAASQFAFKAPAGSTVTNKTVTDKAGAGSSHAATPDKNANPAVDSNANQSVTVGQDWTSVAIFRGVQIPKQLNQYLQAATSVMNGQAKLLPTSLVNILVLNDGRVAVGAVNASALEAAVAAAP
jgi:outer membrane lipoprotein-sorting protein